MVKRTVLARRFKKSPQKKHQNNRKLKRRSRKSLRRQKDFPPDEEMLKDLTDPPASSHGIDDSRLDQENRAPQVLAESADGKQMYGNSVSSMDESVIILDNSAADSNPLGDESCFIIDVEPSQESPFLKSLNLNPCGNLSEPENPNEDSTDTGVKANGTCYQVDLNKNGSVVVESTEKSGDLQSLDKPGSPSLSRRHDAGETRISPQYVGQFNSIVSQMRNEGLIDNIGNRDLAASPGPTKEMGRRRKWNLYRKNLMMTKEQKKSVVETEDANSQSQKSVQPDSTKAPLDDHIAVASDSDSDIEFVGAFNPQDRLIELSDSEDSVIIEGVIPSIIPLPKKEKKVGKSRVSGKKGPPKKRKKIEEVPAPVPVEPARLRPIVIDGCNVGMGYSRNKTLSVEGIKMCHDYFHSRGHEVKIFLPQLKKYHPLTSNPQLLDKMEKEGTVIFTPGRRVDGRPIGSYDDRLILEYASVKGAIVITRDNYKDLYAEKEDFRDTIRNRLLQYTFVGDMIMFPQDPLGRRGPSLETFLRFPPDQQPSSEPQDKP